jgi:hypothetical protein
LLAYSGALLLAAVATKILRVSHLDLTTAQQLATQGNPTTILLGILILFFPAIPFLGLLISWRVIDARERRPATGTTTGGLLAPYVTATLTVLLMITTVPVQVFAPALAIMLGLVIVQVVDAGWRAIRRHRGANRWRPPQGKRRSMPRPLAHVTLILLMCLGTGPLLYQVFNDAVWLPAMQVQMSDQDRGDFVGYEIAATDTQIILLRDDERRVVILSRADVRSMEPCRLTGLMNTGPTVVAVLTGARRPSTPPCRPASTPWHG